MNLTKVKRLLRRGGATPTEASVPLGGRPVALSHPLFQIRSAELEASVAAQSQNGSGPVRSATWFVPYFHHLAFGGIHTIFRFVSGFAEHGVATRIVIYDNPEADVVELKDEIAGAFPPLAEAELVTFDLDPDRVEELPPTDIGVCTFWASAYLLLRFNQTGRKYYFIQDYESLFYLAGSIYALAESTYRFGFTGIVNTPGLLDALEGRHGVEGASFVPAVDRRYYYPPSERDEERRPRVFFYARPGQARNAFELGLLVVERLLGRYGDRIEIVTAGSEWDERQFGLRGRITNVGLLGSHAEVGDLYRSSDIGFVYSLSKHPSYQPFEFMACGMATVSNRNEDNVWFLRDGVNCLLAEPSPASMAEKIGLLIEDDALRDRIKRGGLASVEADWNPQVEAIWRYVVERAR